MKVLVEEILGKEPATYEFAPKEVTLLRGDNGAGKTTLLDALSWALYGKRRKNLCPKGSHVKIEMSGLVVERWSHPKRLKVTDGIGELEGDEAQAHITSVFQSYELWLVSSYLKQRSRSALVSGKDSARVEILSQMTFGSASPEETLSVIQEEHKEARSLLQHGSALLEDRRGMTRDARNTEETARRALDGTSTVGDSRFQMDSETLTSALEEKQASLAVEIHLATEWESYAKERKRLSGEIEIVGVVREVEDITAEIRHRQEKKASVDSALRVERARLMTLTSGLSHAKDTRVRLSVINGHLQSLTDAETAFNDALREIESLNAKKTRVFGAKIKEEDIWESSRGEEAHRTLLAKCKELLVTPTQEGINRSLEDTKARVVEIEGIRTWAMPHGELASARAALARAREGLGKMTEQGVRAERATYEQLLLQKKALPCPNCGVGLLLRTGKLIPMAHGHNHSEEMLAKRKKLVEDAEAALSHVRSLMAKVEQLGKLLTGKPSGYVTKEDEKVTKKRLASLMELKYAEPPQESSAKLTAVLKAQKAMGTVVELSSYHNMPPDEPIEKVRDTLKMFVKRIEDRMGADPQTLWEESRGKVEKMENKMVKLSKGLSELKEEQKCAKESFVLCEQLKAISFPNPEESVRSLRDTTALLRKFVSLARSREERVRSAENEAEHQGDVEELAAKASACQVLLELAEQTRQSMMQETVDRLNVTIAAISREILPDWLSISLSLFRELKTGGGFRDEVGVRVSDEGSPDTRSGNETSIGESDQISFVLALAMASLSPSPLLLLDEPLSGVNVGKRIRGVDALRRAISGTGKTVVFVTHAEIEGCFDRVVDMKAQDSFDEH